MPAIRSGLVRIMSRGNTQKHAWCFRAQGGSFGQQTPSAHPTQNAKRNVKLSFTLRRKYLSPCSAKNPNTTVIHFRSIQGNNVLRCVLRIAKGVQCLFCWWQFCPRICLSHWFQGQIHAIVDSVVYDFESGFLEDLSCAKQRQETRAETLKSAWCAFNICFITRLFATVFLPFLSFLGGEKNPGIRESRAPEPVRWCRPFIGCRLDLTKRTRNRKTELFSIRLRIVMQNWIGNRSWKTRGNVRA